MFCDESLDAVEAIAAEVVRQLGVRDRAGAVIVRQAADDALARRRPRW